MRKTIIKLYKNKNNPNKYIEVHNDGYGHNAFRQFMFWHDYKGTGFKSYTGDGYLHRIGVSILNEILKDYYELFSVDYL